MANHVYQYVDIEANESALEEWQRIKQLVHDKLEKEYPNDFLQDASPEDYAPLIGMPKLEEEHAWDWYCDNVGAKWCHITEAEDNYFCMYSAWSIADAFVEKLTEYLSQWDPEIKLINQYDDEFYNFTGVMVTEWAGETTTMDYDEMTWEEIQSIRGAVIEVTPADYDWSDDEEFDDWLMEWKERARESLC